ncbi:MAG: HEAT repeat domain-containing protein [Deltaproteobacteria bacterium]|nr:HEAT repeat domain-containing protein [Deltaproteobacteria bacterium]
MTFTRTFVAVALGGLAAAVSCRGCGERICVSRVMLSGVPESAQSGLAGGKIRDAISKEASGSTPFRVDPGAKDGWTLKIGLRGVVDAVASGAAPSPGDEALRMDVKLQRHDEKTGLDAYAVVVALSAEDMGALRASANPEAKVAALVAGGLSRIRTQMRLRGFEHADLIKELAANEAWRRELAVEELGRRRSREAAPQLLLKLKDPERSVAMKAVGALVAAGDTAVAAPIIEFARGKDAATQIQILYAVSQLGGPVAEGYLFVMATGHSDLQIAHAAKEAFDELEGRKAKAAGQHRTAAE